jgi:hypothetical protein
MKLNPRLLVLPRRGRFIIVDGDHEGMVISPDKTAKQEIADRISAATKVVADAQRELDFLNQVQREFQD